VTVIKEQLQVYAKFKELLIFVIFVLFCTFILFSFFLFSSLSLSLSFAVKEYKFESLKLMQILQAAYFDE
jgi:hypothetical protein